ncbi:MAG: hypothetical protein IKI31_04035 [Treponema sp.]|nr:hypothetical protein [Treponema sp.]
MRFLLYVSHIYEKIIDKDLRFAKTVQKVPLPEFYVFYTGRDKLPEVSTLNFSDALSKNNIKIENPHIELATTVYNLSDLSENLRQCKILQEYSTFVKIVDDEFKKDDKDCFTRAINYCIKNDILADYLKRNTTEVHNMLFGEYDRETDIRVQCAEAREIALAEGISVGRAEGISVGRAEERRNRNIEIAKQMLQNNMRKSDIHMYTSLSLEEIEALQKE